MFIITPRQRTTHGLPGAPWEDRKQPASGATALYRPFRSFSFFGGVRRPVALVAGAAALCALAERLWQRGQPRQAACGDASRWLRASGKRPPNVAGGAAGRGIRPAAVANLR